MLSNYPPGVTGHEPQITGEDDAPELPVPFALAYYTDLEAALFDMCEKFAEDGSRIPDDLRRRYADAATTLSRVENAYWEVRYRSQRAYYGQWLPGGLVDMMPADQVGEWFEHVTYDPETDTYDVVSYNGHRATLVRMNPEGFPTR